MRAPIIAPPVPSVRVTIGRIEVRAAPPPDAPLQPVDAAPTIGSAVVSPIHAMTLDEYLAQRNTRR
jgi:hypothetical protein